MSAIRKISDTGSHSASYLNVTKNKKNRRRKSTLRRLSKVLAISSLVVAFIVGKTFNKSNYRQILADQQEITSVVAIDQQSFSIGFEGRDETGFAHVGQEKGYG